MLIALVSVVVQRTLRPMNVLARDLDRRTEHDLAALLAGPVPNELRPFIASINKLLARLDGALAAQRRFVAVAAHELRSPLTALTLQAEQLSARIRSAEEKEFMARLQTGLQRMRGLLDQLLTLARADAGPVERDPAASSVASILRSVIEEHMPLAEARQIDLGVVGEMADARVAGKAVDIHAMLRNLLDNAIRYTPVGGRVDISVRRDGDRVRIDIVDDGPGISAEEIAARLRSLLPGSRQRRRRLGAGPGHRPGDRRPPGRNGQPRQRQRHPGASGAGRPPGGEHPALGHVPRPHAADTPIGALAAAATPSAE